ncbi:uncharacterized protein PFL1_05031 [Pseudozyma flocculosa PF-1]|uniref:Uncharacterized protein n=1 Tax=Pseudozyma flocculosa PF-1 TaxID=1277687 RepID=A0A061H4I3_9BASI|nr:uncharacterized protein PFL1_05031 [Pseudozyma flocculosa PF-1]EPQ27493.1 hypothetical protein PFL1_05031 [Pseudozyma flocculosa PF-1]
MNQSTINFAQPGSQQQPPPPGAPEGWPQNLGGAAFSQPDPSPSPNPSAQMLNPQQVFQPKVGSDRPP